MTQLQTGLATARPLATDLRISDAPTAAIRVQDLRKTYGDNASATHALRGVTLDVFPGEIVGVLGPNGAGKTTLMEILEGLRKPSQGKVEILGNSIGNKQHNDSIRARIGVAVQNSVLPPLLTVGELLALQAILFGDNAQNPDELVEAVCLGDKRNSRIQHLSGGQQQRIALATALVGNPDILFLDEPTSQLDPQARRQIWDLILRQRQRKNAAVLLTTHQMEEAEKLCDRVFILDAGEILAQGTPDELIQRYCPEHTLEFFVKEMFPTDLLPADSHCEFKPGGLNASGCPKRFTALVKSADINHVFRVLVDKGIVDGISLTDMKVTRQTLEDVFIKLTGRGIRD